MNEKGSVGVDWNALPAEAQWVAMDAHGAWFWYKRAPVISNRTFTWQPRDFDCDVFEGPPCDDWTKSLQPRPASSSSLTAEDWIPWNGSDTTLDHPTLDAHTIVEVQFASGYKSGRSGAHASSFD